MYMNDHSTILSNEGDLADEGLDLQCKPVRLSNRFSKNVRKTKIDFVESIEH
jgi:hypothetical protein